MLANRTIVWISMLLFLFCLSCELIVRKSFPAPAKKQVATLKSDALFFIKSLEDQEGATDLVYVGKNSQGIDQYVSKDNEQVLLLIPAEIHAKNQKFGTSPLESGITRKETPRPSPVVPKTEAENPTAKLAPFVPKASTPKPKQNTKVKTSAKQKKHYWHESYHEKPHPPICQDVYWHPYLLTFQLNPYFKEVAEKYRLFEHSANYLEEIDVSSYPKEHQWTYRNIIRQRCNKCHSPARYFNRHFPPQQWKITLQRVQSLGMIPIDKPEWKEHLYKFFVYYEENRIDSQE